MSHIFVSYTREDQQFVAELIRRLRDENFNLWLDRDSIRSGDDWQVSIDNALRSAQAIIVVVTPKSRQSEYVTYEWSFAMSLGIPIIPALVSGSASETHPKLSRLQAVDFTVEDKQSWSRLIERLRSVKPESQIDQIFNTREKFPDFTVWLEECDEMWIAGRDLTGLINGYYDEIKKAIQNGKRFRILVANHNNMQLMEVIATSSILHSTPEDRARVIEANIDHFTKFKSKPKFLLKATDFFPMNSYVIADGEDNERGRMTVEMFGHKIAAGGRLHITLTRASAPNAFEYHLQQFKTMWG